MEQEVYREVVFSGDSEIRNRASALIVELTQQIMDSERERRIITLEAIRGYLVKVANVNDGLIPVEVMHIVIDDVLAGRK